MDDPTYKQILSDIFDVLEFSVQEKEDAFSDFQEELAGALFDTTQDALSDEQRTWLKENGATLSGDELELQGIRDAISAKYTNNELKAMTRPLFKEIVSEYLDYMSQDEDAELKEKLREIRNRL